jgi:hypothetical protein
MASDIVFFNNPENKEGGESIHCFEDRILEKNILSSGIGTEEILKSRYAFPRSKNSYFLGGFITDSAVFAIMSRVNKVIIGTHGIMADGGLMVCMPWSQRCGWLFVCSWIGMLIDDKELPGLQSGRNWLSQIGLRLTTHCVFAQ